MRIRTRALITTLAARLLLGDLFLHGIGGAKYDHVTDRLIADFFGLEPPGYMVVSGTLHLPVTHQPAQATICCSYSTGFANWNFIRSNLSANRVKRVQQPAAGRPIGSLKSAVGLPPKRRRRPRATRCRAIRRANEAMQPIVEPVRREWTAEADQLSEKLRGEAVLASREYGFVLYPELLLTKFFQ